MLAAQTVRMIKGLDGLVGSGNAGIIGEDAGKRDLLSRLCNRGTSSVLERISMWTGHLWFLLLSLVGKHSSIFDLVEIISLLDGNILTRTAAISMLLRPE
jgi:hypothetical protein